MLALGIALGCGAPRKLVAAREHYARALQLLEAAHGGVHPSLFEPLEMLADVEHVFGDHAAARAHFERGVALARQLTGLGAGTSLSSPPEGFGRALALVHRYALHLRPESAERQMWERWVVSIHAAPDLDERLRRWGVPMADARCPFDVPTPAGGRRYSTSNGGVR